MPSPYTDRAPPALAPVPSLPQFPGHPPSPYAQAWPNLPLATPFPPAPRSIRPLVQASAPQSSFDIRYPSISPRQPQIPFSVHQNTSLSQPTSSSQSASTFDRPWPQLSNPPMIPMPRRPSLEEIKAKQVLDICKSLQNLYQNPRGKEFDIYHLLFKLKSHVSLVPDDQWGSSNEFRYFLRLSDSTNGCQTTGKPKRPGRKGIVMCARCRTQRHGSRVCPISVHCIDYRTLALALLVVLTGPVYPASKHFNTRNVA